MWYKAAGYSIRIGLPMKRERFKKERIGQFSRPDTIVHHTRLTTTGGCSELLGGPPELLVLGFGMLILGCCHELKWHEFKTAD